MAVPQGAAREGVKQLSPLFPISKRGPGPTITKETGPWMLLVENPLQGEQVRILTPEDQGIAIGDEAERPVACRACDAQASELVFL